MCMVLTASTTTGTGTEAQAGSSLLDQLHLNLARAELAPYVYANLEVMRDDTIRMRTSAKGLNPFVLTNLQTRSGLAEVVAFIEPKGMLLPAAEK